MTLVDVTTVLESTARLATPLVLAAFGGLFSEQAGIIALGLEGMMLAGAFASGTVAALGAPSLVALIAGTAAGAAVAMIHGWVSITRRGEQIVSAMALNILMSGLCPALGLGWFDSGGGTPALAPDTRVMPLAFGVNGLVFATAIAVPALAYLLYRTRLGLHLRATGTDPAAVHAAGLSVVRLRYAAVAIGGALAGLGGVYIAIGDGAGFTRDMTAGRGYVALAALIFGGWRPFPVAAGCLLFAFADALQLRLQGTDLPIVGAVPVQLIQAIPYLVTLAALAGFAGGMTAPAALGRPFRRQD